MHNTKLNWRWSWIKANLHHVMTGAINTYPLSLSLVCACPHASCVLMTSETAATQQLK